LDWFELGFVDEAQGGFVKGAQFIFGGFVTRELDEVALLKELGEAHFLVLQEKLGGLELEEEFFRGSFWCVELEPLFEVDPEGDGNLAAEEAWIADEREGLLKALFGSDMGRNRGSARGFGHFLHPAFVEEASQNGQGGESEESPKPSPAVGDVDRRCDISDVLSHGVGWRGGGENKSGVGGGWCGAGLSLHLAL